MTVDKDTILCPTCGKAGTWRADNESKPFCSARCKLIDLGEWAEGRAIPGEPVDLPNHDEDNETDNSDAGNEY